MAYVTRIGSNPAQVEYRLTGGHGCADAGRDGQGDYHLEDRERPLTWIGAGLERFGIQAGTALVGDADKAKARALLGGCDPVSGEQLVAAKVGVPDDAKLRVGVLVRAVRAACDEGRGTPLQLLGSARMAATFTRAERAYLAKGEGALMRADHAGQVADAAGIDVDRLWGSDAFAAAVNNLSQTKVVTGEDGVSREAVVPRRVEVGNRGYDVTFTLPKSFSVLMAFADQGDADRLEAAYTANVGRTFDWLEAATAYGMRGHHGEGKAADVVPGEGFAGWTMTHRAARPVGDADHGDPHWHVHVTLANMTCGTDGKWSTVAAGGRDLMRHVPAADKVLAALVRSELHSQFGVGFERSERTGLWEVAGVPEATLRQFSKRGVSIESMLSDLGLDQDGVSKAQQRLAKDLTRQAKPEGTEQSDRTLREAWQQEAAAGGVDPAAVAARALRGGPGVGSGVVLVGEDLVHDLARQLTDPEHGLTANRRRFTTAEALAAVADRLPAGAVDVAEIEDLTARVLEHAGVVDIAAQVMGGRDPRRQLAARHMRNAELFTTADVLQAERTILGRVATATAGPQVAAVRAQAALVAQGVAETAQGYDLSAEQRDVMLKVVTSSRAVEHIIGPPGTGKTTLMRAARTAWEADGVRVVGAATAAVAAQNLQAEAGISSRTVAQVVHSIRARDQALVEEAAGWRRLDPTSARWEPMSEAEVRVGQERIELGGLSQVDVLVLDEANLTDDRDRAALYAEAARAQVKIVEVGDPQQLRGVGCGSSFGFAAQMNPDTLHLSENRRQRDEDERGALNDLREGRYRPALNSWAEREALVITDTADQALRATVATWATERDGAPDPHAEMGGLLMLAGTNDAVDRLNQAAQAVRRQAGELGHEHKYQLRGGDSLTLAVGDHVMIRVNDRDQRGHEGDDVLNGYRGVVQDIDADGRVQLEWTRPSPDGPQLGRGVLPPELIATGGLDLGYAMTTHKAEGLTVGTTWTDRAGDTRGGAVIVDVAGSDNPGLYVAASRHTARVVLVGSLEQLEDAQTRYERGPTTDEWVRTERGVDAIASQLERTKDSLNDIPVTADAHDHDPAKTAAAAAELDPWADFTEPNTTPPANGQEVEYDHTTHDQPKRDGLERDER